MRTYDTIVVGTGIGGLTSGLSLQRAGHSVLLLEAAKQFGGMLNPFARKKWHFDVGIHYVAQAGPRGALRTDLDSLGLEQVAFREIDPDCIDRYVFRDYEARLVKGIDRWGDLLAADFPREERNVRRFLELMKLVSELASPGLGLGTVGRALAHGGDLARLIRVPFGALLRRYFDDPLLRSAFAGGGGAVGLPPSRLSALIAIIVLNYYLSGAYYPVGGSGAIRDAYVDALRRHGAELERSQLVERIARLPDGRFEVLTGRGERFVARSVVSNVDVVDTLKLLHDVDASRRTRRKAHGLRPSLSSFCVFLATDLDLPKLGVTDTNIWHYGVDDVDAAYDAVFDHRFPEPPFFFLTAPTLKDPDSGRAPAGQHTLELITLVSAEPFKRWFGTRSMKRDEEYAAFKRRTSDRLLEEVERYLPGLRRHLLHEESATPATVWHFVRGRDGGIYGPEHTPEQIAFRRFLPSIGIPGLYLAGASVFGGGISLCLKSGLAAARSTSRYLRKHRPARIAAAVASAAPRRVPAVSPGRLSQEGET